MFQDFGHLCRGRRVQICGHSDLGIFNNSGASSFSLGCNLIDTAWAACPEHPVSHCSDIHNFCGRLLRCRRTLFCEHCMRVRIVFHNITYEYNTTCAFLKFGLQLRILEMTDRRASAKQNELSSLLSVPLR